MSRRNGEFPYPGVTEEVPDTTQLGSPGDTGQLNQKIIEREERTELRGEGVTKTSSVRFI